jgi:glycolate oxidase iron-sulfur subunit
MCLPSCPTYAASVAEGRSPRGRIAAMRTLVTGPGAATPAMLADLASRVDRGRCEAACPSQVQYAQQLHRTRAALRATRGFTLVELEDGA